jgi:acyl carrier protein
VPRRIVVVDELPQGPTGKPTRIGLADRLGLSSVAPRSARDAPASSPLEASLAALWAQLLGVGQVPFDEDFVALGGDSLSAIQLLAQVGDVFAVEVPVGALFDEGATVRGMAAFIERLRAQGAAPGPSPQQGSVNTYGLLARVLPLLVALRRG